MSRYVFFAIGVLALILVILGVKSATDSYKLLPISTPPQADTSQLFQWVEFSPNTGHFTVLLPFLPQHAAQTMVDPKTKERRVYEMYISQKQDGTIFMISGISFPDGKTPPDDTTIKNLVNDMVAANPDNKLVDMNKSTFQTMPASDFQIENPQVSVTGKAFIDGKTLYLLTMLSPSKTEDKQEFDYFTNSFKLLKKD